MVLAEVNPPRHRRFRSRCALPGCPKAQRPRSRDLAAAIARLTAEYLLGETGRRGLPGERLPGGLDLQLEGAWSEDRAYLKVRLVDMANQKTLWSQRLVASRVAEGRSGSSVVVFEATEAQLM